MTAKRANAGWFRPGHDPRRHVLTTEERRRGFKNATEGAPLYRVRWICGKIRDGRSPAQQERDRLDRQRRFEREMSHF